MQPTSEFLEHYPLPISSNPPQMLAHFFSTIDGATPVPIHPSEVPFPNPLLQMITPQMQAAGGCCFSSSYSTSDDAEEQQDLSIINERRHRRMISNRESARRSRMRKQRHLDELRSQVVWLRNEKQQLMDKLSDFSRDHDRVAQENCLLRAEASELRQIIVDMQLMSSPAFSSLTELDDDHSTNDALPIKRNDDHSKIEEIIKKRDFHSCISENTCKRKVF